MTYTATKLDKLKLPLQRLILMNKVWSGKMIKNKMSGPPFLRNVSSCRATMMSYDHGTTECQD